MHRLVSRPALGIGILATVLILLDLGRRILATNDEARFAVLAQDMLARGAWFFPQLNGTVYHSKPLLLAWLIALCSWPAGHVTQLTVVLPSALAGIGTVLVVHALVLITTLGWFLHERVPMPDMLLTFFITSSLAMFWRMVRGGAGSDWLAFYGLTALAFWAKGVAGLLPLAAGTAYAIATRRVGGWRALHLPAGMVLVGVLITPWWVRQWLFGPGALRKVAVSDNLSWYVPRSLTLELIAGPFQHVVGSLFPWVLVVPVAVWQALRFLRGSGEERAAVHVLIVWAAVLLVGVAISESAAPALLRAAGGARLAPDRLVVRERGGDAPRRRGDPVADLRDRRRRGRAGDGGRERVAADLGERHERRVARFGDRNRNDGGRLLLMIGALGYGVRHAALGRAFVFAWLGSALWVGGWYHWELERRNAAYDYPRAHTDAVRLLPEAPVVAAWGVYELPFTFYFDRKVVAVTTDGDLRRIMAEHPRASAVLTEAALAQVGDRARLRVLPLNRLNFDSIVLVTYSADASRAVTRP